MSANARTGVASCAEVMGLKEWIGAAMIVIAALLEATNGEVNG
ncbi:MAG: hypothetical protein JWQ10_3719 [Herbaspirillum sp.]|nr:hypothetical protein [Herbaspirillum sp.]